jgi:hypothetical protein
MVASKSPVLLSFPLHHSGGTGFSTLGDGKKAGIHRIMFHSARDAALARLLVSLAWPCRLDYSIGSLVFTFQPAVIGAPSEPSGLCGRYSTLIWA